MTQRLPDFVPQYLSGPCSFVVWSNFHQYPASLSYNNLATAIASQDVLQGSGSSTIHPRGLVGPCGRGASIQCRSHAVRVLPAHCRAPRPSGPARFCALCPRPSDRRRKLFQCLHDTGDLRPQRPLHMHLMHLRRRLLQLLDRESLLPSPQRYLQAGPTADQPRLARQEWWLDCVLQLSL